MINTFKIAFRLKNTYRKNGVIFSLKQIPIIKKILPDTLYKSKGLNVFANIISLLLEVGNILIGKPLYIFLMVFLAANYVQGNSADAFLHIFVSLTILGTFINTNLFNPSKDKYYAILLLRMNAREYVLSDFIYFLFKNVVGMLPACIILGKTVGVPLYISMLLPIFLVTVKGIYGALILKKYEKTKTVFNENKISPKKWFVILLFLGAGYGLPFLNIALTNTLFIVLSVVAFLLFIPSVIYLAKFNDFSFLCKELLQGAEIVFDTKEFYAATVKESASKQIDETTLNISQKDGYAGFHDIFVKRHRKILMKSAKNTTMVLFTILMGAIIILLTKPDIKADFNRLPLRVLPYFLFIMYLINRGQVITQAMFMNCDQSMLYYSFYRQPKSVLELFKRRLITVIQINLIPACIIATGLPLILYLSGGTDNPLNYIVLFISVIAMSIFFSVHHLVMYYLLQPYNADAQVKSIAFSIVNSFTYLVAFMGMKMQLPTLWFGTIVIIFTILYVVISLMIAYKLAPKTFKLR